MARRLLCRASDLDPFLRAVADDGYVLFGNQAYMFGQWASDESIDVFGLTREQAMVIPETNAAIIGVSLRNPVAIAFVERWYGAAEDQIAFCGTRKPLHTRDDYANMKWKRAGRASADDPRVLGHRHDKTVAGIVAHQLRVKVTPSGIQAYSAFHRSILPATVIAIDRTWVRAMSK